MKKASGILLILICLLFSLTGCSAIGDKAASMAIIYDLTAIISLLLVGYCCLIRKRDIWFLLLFASVFVVNTGYLTLAHSRTLDEALLANRVSYLGSVCLPMSMLMIIINMCRLKYRKWLPGLLLGISAVVFLIAASPGYSGIYYKSARFSCSASTCCFRKAALPPRNQKNAKRFPMKLLQKSLPKSSFRAPLPAGKTQKRALMKSAAISPPSCPSSPLQSTSSMSSTSREPTQRRSWRS